MHVAFASERRAGYLRSSGAGDAFPEVKALLADAREQARSHSSSRGLGRSRTPALDLTLRAYLGYVDLLTARWLELDETEREHVPVDTVVAIVTGAFRGSLAA